MLENHSQQKEVQNLLSSKIHVFNQKAASPGWESGLDELEIG